MCKNRVVADGAGSNDNFGKKRTEKEK